jgi:hypothetical protein
MKHLNSQVITADLITEIYSSHVSCVLLCISSCKLDTGKLKVCEQHVQSKLDLKILHFISRYAIAATHNEAEIFEYSRAA